MRKNFTGSEKILSSTKLVTTIKLPATKGEIPFKNLKNKIELQTVKGRAIKLRLI